MGERGASAQAGAWQPHYAGKPHALECLALLAHLGPLFKDAAPAHLSTGTQISHL
jgi:hypothetical protein